MGKLKICSNLLKKQGHSRIFFYVTVLATLSLISSCNLSNKKTESDTAIEEKVYLDSLISLMTLKEKVSMVHGAQGTDAKGRQYVGYIPGIKRLGIPPLRMQNGPSGAGASFTSFRHLAPATAFPVPIVQASTWNEDLQYKVGQAIGSEVKAQGRDMVLGPGVNIIRVPEGGRNFEYFSEDPYVCSRFGVDFINGVQSMGTMTSVKHFVANNQESDRFTIDEQIASRPLREIYLPAFEAAVKETKVSSIMAAYNKINGVYCSENPLLLTDIVRNEWGYKGLIMTDWGTRHHTVSAANSGLGMEMDGWGKFGDPKFKEHLEEAVKKGEVKETTLDKMVYYTLSEMYRFGLLKDKKDFPKGQMDTPEHRALAYRVAVEGIVLLKNNNVLPLNAEEIKNVGLFGDAMVARASGEGSSKVVPFYSVSPYKGISDYLKNTEVTYFTSVHDVPSVQSADVGIVFIYRLSSEGNDRKSISLADESKLIDEVSKKYRKTIVVLRTAGSYVMPWLDKVDAVLQAGYPGQEEGNAEAALLFGVENPSGKLTVTYGKERSDFPATQQSEFPGIGEKVNYAEGIYVGYRWFEKEGIKPLFPFGYGLSYTTFKYTNLSFSKVPTDKGVLKVSYALTNTGEKDGAEVSQLYVSDTKASVDRPKKELKGFSKVFLKAGESKTVEHIIKKRDLSFWDGATKGWKVEDGEFNILIGASSEDIRLKKSFVYK